MNRDSLNELLYQMLETEMGGVQVYTTAIRCAINDDLKKEWKKYLDQTQNHVKVVRGIFDQMGLDPEADTPGRITRDGDGAGPDLRAARGRPARRGGVRRAG